MHASFLVRAPLVPYAIQTYDPTAGALSLNKFFLLPGTTDLGETATATSWTSSKLDLRLVEATGGGTVVVRLLYAPKVSCKWAYECSGVRRSPPRDLAVGPPGPLIPTGTLVGRSGASGSYPITSVAGNVTTPTGFTVWVKSSASGQSVHIAWDVACTKGGDAKDISGGWDDTTPVEDASIRMPFVQPDSCTVSVSAQLTSGDGSISLAVYANGV